MAMPNAMRRENPESADAGHEGSRQSWPLVSGFLVPLEARSTAPEGKVPCGDVRRSEDLLSGHRGPGTREASG